MDHLSTLRPDRLDWRCSASSFVGHCFQFVWNVLCCRASSLRQSGSCLDVGTGPAWKCGMAPATRLCRPTTPVESLRGVWMLPHMAVAVVRSERFQQLQQLVARKNDGPSALNSQITWSLERENVPCERRQTRTGDKTESRTIPLAKCLTPVVSTMPLSQCS